MLEVYIDGCCEPNPGGTASYGVVVLRKEEATPIHTQCKGVLYRKEDIVVWEDSKVVGSGPGMSNNVAEYSGLIAFLEWFDKQPVEDVVIYSDSQLLINQMQGLWKVRKGLYIYYYQRALSIMVQNANLWKDRIKFKWIPREDNTLADALSVKALAEVGIYRRKG